MLKCFQSVWLKLILGVQISFLLGNVVKNLITVFTTVSPQQHEKNKPSYNRRSSNVKTFVILERD